MNRSAKNLPWQTIEVPRVTSRKRATHHTGYAPKTTPTTARQSSNHSLSLSDRNMLALLHRYGDATVSFQVLDSGFSYWGEPRRQCIAYVDTGRAWVAAGQPLCPSAERGATAQRFATEAWSQGRRVSFFAVDQPEFLRDSRFRCVCIGRQPLWRPHGWAAKVEGSSSLRYQLRRAHRKGVRVQWLSAGALARVRPAIEPAALQLLAAWLQQKPMATMGFLARPEPFAGFEQRQYGLAWQDGSLVGLVATAPVYKRHGLLLDDLIRHPDAPNGTAELLVDSAMRSAAAQDLRVVAMGLAPLAGPVSRQLRFFRRLGNPLYNFAGVERFKQKLLPDTWENVYTAFPQNQCAATAIYDGLAAFAGGSLIRFGVETLRLRFNAPLPRLCK